MSKTQAPDPMVMVAELEMEMMSDMYRRMTNTCQAKCIAAHYKEADLTKGESVCLDRCVAKYLDVHEKLGKVLTNMTQQDDKQLQQLQKK
ncbi:unnamed protein product [Bursaphelenchus okinawaensis]|uniref:Mitochondrial import inner membrane translocase subunit n=1 Tax=Bursaphelenchus okinawaensis TaxID=465554 RepID=A0A811JTN7_9BILA|nr:unnamed protein product [Bursaphelenchus okinawaensis]CAG9081974.1 unnamed protein product [Bursaphelenchus okinawaensis]